MILLEINKLKFRVSSKLSVLDACKFIGIVLPHFCYHETLSIAGNCRLCLIEVLNSPKPIASCALPVLNNMKVFTDTPLVQIAREIILESLLLNHPLDCPICDQGGECDLQDQSKVFGQFSSRYFFKKRAVEDKFFNPLIKTIMNRCIHCTRCVRFDSEIANVSVLGTLNRGGSTEIGNYVKSILNSEISANIIDLCPVGALTSKPYSFKARPWELRLDESIDLTDGLGSNIYINSKGSELYRILPKINADINSNIISDKARFYSDYIKNLRLKTVLKKKNETNSFEKLSWEDFMIDKDIEKAFSIKQKITFLVNDELDLNSYLLLKCLQSKNKNINISTLNNVNKINNLYFNTLSNSIKCLLKQSRVCFILSSNLKIESAVLNSKLRLKNLNEDINFFGFSLSYKSNFTLKFINLNILQILKIFEGKNNILSKLLILYKSPLFIFGESLKKRGIDIQYLNFFLKKKLATAIILNIKTSCNSSAIDLLNIKDISTNALFKSDLVLFFNLDNTFFVNKILIKLNKKNIIWANTHDIYQSKIFFDFLIPLPTSFEKSGIYINLEGRPQKTLKIFDESLNTRSLKQLVNVLFIKNEYKNFNFLTFYNEVLNNPKVFKFFKPSFILEINNVYNKQINNISLYPVKYLFEDFYYSNYKTKMSTTMVECSKNLRKNFNNF